MTSIKLHACPIFDPRDNAEITLSNAELPPGLTAPAGALTLLYGSKDILAEASRQNRIAVARNQRTANINLILNVTFPQGSLSIDRLPSVTALHLRRAHQSIGRLIQAYWLSYQDVEDPYGDGFTYFSTARPDLMARLHQEPEFRHLDVIMYRIKRNGGTQQFASVFRLPEGWSIDTLYPRNSVVLPDFMTKQAA